MGYTELVESLRREGEEKISQLWSEVKTEAEKIKAETSGRIKEMREEYRKSQEGAIREQEEVILSESKDKARMIRLLAEKTLLERLFPMAVSLLHELRKERYQDVFTLLAREFLDLQWEEVWVNPEDVETAREHFPDSKITSDDTITGGIKAMREDGKIYIHNTFEKRLERIWEDIQPSIIRDIYQEVSEHGITSES
jgi:vacuolar-type H+-ATPase subunit E/Vma4